MVLFPNYVYLIPLSKDEHKESKQVDFDFISKFCLVHSVAFKINSAISWGSGQRTTSGDDDIKRYLDEVLVELKRKKPNPLRYNSVTSSDLCVL